MIRIPIEEITKIKKSLENEGFPCKKEIEKPSYGLHRYACDFDTKGEQNSSLSVSWMRNKLVQDDKFPHLVPTHDFEYTYVESMIVVPRKGIGCPNPIDLSELKIKYLPPHDTLDSCFHHYSGEDISLRDIEKFIKKIPK